MRNVSHHAAILRASKDKGTKWPKVVGSLLPGAHAILIGDRPDWEQSVIAARRAGLEVRDMLAVVTAKGLLFTPLLRKPLAESSATKQILATKTGAINIDASRVYTDWDEPDRPDSWKRSGFTSKPGAEKIAAPPGQGINCHPKGRWPSNLAFIHAKTCTISGTKTVKSHNPDNKKFDRVSQDVYGVLRSRSLTHHAVDGKEVVPNWVCAPGCPVPSLDEQSGSGASRFYKQFRDDEELIAYLTALVLPADGVLMTGFPR